MDELLNTIQDLLYALEVYVDKNDQYCQNIIKRALNILNKYDIQYHFECEDID